MFSDFLDDIRSVLKPNTGVPVENDFTFDIRSSFGDFRRQPATRTITVAKPFCSPARDIVYTALESYGVNIYGYTEETIKQDYRFFLRRWKVEKRTWENLKYGPFAALHWLPMAIQATVDVSEKQAVWAEYLLLRTGKLYIVGDYQDDRNQRWAERHNGVMPVAWGKRPFIEKSCMDGVKVWETFRAEIDG